MIINKENVKIWFELIKDNIYKICASKPYVLEYARILHKNNEIFAYDPSGGPFLTTGCEIDGKILNNIFFENGNLYFELNDV